MATKKPTRQRPAAKPSRIDAVRDLVGVLTDAEVAAKAGVTSSAVHQYRQRHGIKPALPQGTTRRALERREGERRKGEDEASDEGAPPARGAAARSGRSSDRRGADRGAPRAAAADDASGDRRRSKIDQFRDLVGVLTDPEVAERAGVTRTAVQMYRKKHGIPPAGPPGDPAVARSRAPTPSGPQTRTAAAPAPAQRAVSAGAGSAAGGALRGRTYAFKVVVNARSGEVVKIVIAEDAAVAAERGRTLGEVLMVEWLGEAM